MCNLMVDYFKTIEKGFPYPKHKYRLLYEYRKILGPRIEEKTTLLELGTFKGASIKFWSEYYLIHPESQIVGIDVNPRGVYNKKVKLYRCNQGDSEELHKIGSEFDPVDIIIDDCSHDYNLTLKSFRVLWEYLRPGGYYIIEDWTVIRRAGDYLIFDLLLGLEYSEIIFVHKKSPEISVSFFQKA